MKRIIVVAMAMMVVAAAAFGGGSAEAAKKPIVFVWYPNESGAELKGAREEIGRIISGALGRPVEHKTTTDYTIAIEAIASDNAALAFMGAQGYIEAHTRNAKVVSLFTNSGKSGTLKDAIYYSWMAVKKGAEDQYRSGDSYSIDNIQGVKFSFVSNSSTSGFKVPTAGIVSHFSKKAEWATLQQSDLLEGGTGKFFSEVLYGGSHQGAAVNLLAGKADVAAFCDTEMDAYMKLVSGQESRPGAVYQVKDGAPDPFSSRAGERIVLIKTTPVQNGPVAVNTDVLSAQEVQKIRDAFLSDAVTNNEKIFAPKGSGFVPVGGFAKGLRFLAVEDAWYDPIRELSK